MSNQRQVKRKKTLGKKTMKKTKGGERVLGADEWNALRPPKPK